MSKPQETADIVLAIPSGRNVVSDVLGDTTYALNTIEANASTMLQMIGPLRSLEEISRETGGFVQIKPEFGFMPTLIDRNEQPVFLYHLIESFEEHLDYEAIFRDYPTLSLSQIAGALSFVRKVAQINSRRVDIDALEDDFDLQNSNFLDELRKAYNERGNVARVLTDAV